jgi:hypothetical protein
MAFRSSAAQGVGPQDGFTGTSVFNDPNPARPRWGDYGAAVPDQNGNVWLASESIGQSCTLSQYVAAPVGSCGGTEPLWPTGAPASARCM